MNKKVVVSGVIILLLLLGGLYFVKSKKSLTSPTSTISEPYTEQKSLKDLLSSGVAQKCTYSTSSESGSTTGSSYISSGKVRGDFTTTTSEKTTTSHMISDGSTSYVWTDGEVNGFKMTVTDQTNTDAPDAPSTAGADLNQKADYDCSAWVVDDSYFTPPSSVTFTDFSQMLSPSGAPTQGSGGASSQCSYCNTLSGDDKTQCLTALKCN